MDPAADNVLPTLILREEAKNVKSPRLVRSRKEPFHGRDVTGIECGGR